MKKHPSHEPVLLDEVIEWLQPQQGGLFIDCTLGLGGHAEAILNASPETRLVGIDRDREAIEIASERLAVFKDRFRVVQANFKEIACVLGGLESESVRGILADLGVSSLQFDDRERGFSFQSDAPLDMRMDRSEGETAADLINSLDESELANLIFEYGEERGSRRIARIIVRERERQPVTTTKQLADLVVRALRVPGRWRIHPATRTFQALRIAVNDELKAIENLIPEAVGTLASGGRLAIISFHSLEDRIVKRGFLRESGRCICEADYKRVPAAPPKPRPDLTGEVVCERCGARARVSILTRKPISPGHDEVERNARSRSARLRVCERI
jgi:16S rRNA (cytosine1402-N4)-methyltransferase